MRRSGGPAGSTPGPLKDVSGWLEHYRRFWDESFDRLDAYLDELQGKGAPLAQSSSALAEPADRVLSITRTFAAPRELVFKVWTQPEHLARWWGPKGFSTPTCQMDARPGGDYRAVIRSPEGKDSVMRGSYREVVPPERLVMTFAWEDEEGQPEARDADHGELRGHRRRDQADLRARRVRNLGRAA